MEASYSQAVMAHLQARDWPGDLLDGAMSFSPECSFARHSWLSHLQGILWVLTHLRLSAVGRSNPAYSLDVLLGIAVELLRGVMVDVVRLVYLRRELGKDNRYWCSFLPLQMTVLMF